MNSCKHPCLTRRWEAAQGMQRYRAIILLNPSNQDRLCERLVENSVAFLDHSDIQKTREEDTWSGIYESIQALIECSQHNEMQRSLSKAGIHQTM